MAQFDKWPKTWRKLSHGTFKTLAFESTLIKRNIAFNCHPSKAANYLTGKRVASGSLGKDLGVHMDGTLNFDEHKNFSSSCLSSLECQINGQVKHLLDTNTLSNFINALVFSKLYSCSSVWSSSTNRNFNKLQNVQNFAARIVTRSRKFDHITAGLRELKYLSVESMLV